MFNLRPSHPQDADRVMYVWRSAVDATHEFLSAADRFAIEHEVAAFIPQQELELAVDRSDCPVAFMFLHDGHMEALFVDPNHHGKGIGRALVRAALQRNPQSKVDVNEQNSQAAGFYERMGFVPVGRSELDGQGRPYPLIHLQYGQAS